MAPHTPKNHRLPQKSPLATNTQPFKIRPHSPRNRRRLPNLLRSPKNTTPTQSKSKPHRRHHPQSRPRSPKHPQNRTYPRPLRQPRSSPHILPLPSQIPPRYGEVGSHRRRRSNNFLSHKPHPHHQPFRNRPRFSSKDARRSEKFDEICVYTLARNHVFSFSK